MESSMLLEMFERADLIKNDEINYLRLGSIKKTHLVDILKQSIEVTMNEKIKPSDTIFSHSASMSLGGGTTPCAAIECRKNNLKHLVQFSALYSDRVYIDNFFTGPLAKFEVLKESEFKREIIDNLLLLLDIKPMLDSGIIVPVTSKNTCSYCLAHNKCGAEVPDCFDDVKDYVYAMFDKNTSVDITFEGKDIYWIRVSGPDDLIAHGGSNSLYKLKELPKKVRESDFFNKLKKHHPAKLPDELKAELMHHRRIADEHLDTIRFETSNADVLKSSYLSEQSLHIEILNKFFANSETQKVNNIIQRHMTTLLPFIDGLNAKQVIQLRKNEEESFILFRKSLNDAIRNHISKISSDFTDRNALEIFSEFIQPELARLDRTVKSAERQLSKGIIRKLVSLTGALSFGFFQGYMPNLAVVAGSLLTNIAGMQEWAMNQSDTEETIRNDNMYFLWKVRQSAR